MSSQQKLIEIVLSKSVCSTDWLVARLEWEIIGIEDNESCDSVCECGQQGLRWEYYLKNIYTKHQIMVGTSCIKWFDNPKMESIKALFEKSDKPIEYFGKIGKYTYKGLSKEQDKAEWFYDNFKNKFLREAKKRKRRDQIIAYLDLLKDYAIN